MTINVTGDEFLNSQDVFGQWQAKWTKGTRVLIGDSTTASHLPPDR